MPRVYTKVDPEIRFWAKVDKNGPIPEFRPELGNCWIWIAKARTWGYGIFYSTKMVRAHRYSYELHNGPVTPWYYEVDHLCRVRLCVNPAHLEAVPGEVNRARGFSFAALKSRQTTCIRGHDLSGDNLHINVYGRRQCRECDAMRARGYRARKKQVA